MLRQRLEKNIKTYGNQFWFVKYSRGLNPIVIVIDSYGNRFIVGHPMSPMGRNCETELISCDLGIKQVSFIVHTKVILCD